MGAPAIKVKICGNTSLEDALCAAEAGADLLGFIFYARSPRHITPAAAAAVIAQLRARGHTAQCVGVFVNAPEPELASVAALCALDAVQLHGDEPAERVGARAFKAVKRADAATELCIAAARAAKIAPALPELLIDADHATLYGGSGQRADQSAAQQLARRCRLLLAGGLTPGNVAEAIAHVRPWGVDVASGTEAAPGRKDPAKVRAFVDAVRRAGH